MKSLINKIDESQYFHCYIGDKRIFYIYSDNILAEIFQKLTNKKSNICYDNFNDILNNNKNKDPNHFTEKFYIDSCERINQKIKSLGINTNEYFNKILRYNFLRIL